MEQEMHSEIWNRFKNGDWEAFASLYNEYFRLLNNYGGKFTKDTDIIEDAIHDLFLRLWTSRDNLKSPLSVKNYLYKSLRNILFRKLKQQEKFGSIHEQEDFHPGFTVSFSNDAIDKIEDREAREKMKSYIEMLPPRQQEIIYLRFYEGLTYEEISELMSISISSTYKLLYKAIDNLQHLFGPAASSLGVLLCSKTFFRFFCA